MINLIRIALIINNILLSKQQLKIGKIQKMQELWILKYILPTFLVLIVSLLADNFLVEYLPQMEPLESFRLMRQQDNRKEQIAMYLIKWYVIYVIAGLFYLGFVIKLYYRSIKCQKFNKKALKSQQSIDYQSLPTHEQNGASNRRQQVEDILFLKELDKTIIAQIQSSQSLFTQIIMPYTVSLIILFIITLSILTLIQSQIYLVSSSLKNGTHNSRWMGMREFQSMDFFHNVPKQFNGNDKIMELFEVQDSAVNGILGWISNYKLFFGLFYLMLRTVGIWGIGFCVVLLMLISKVTSEKREGSSRKQVVLLETVKFGSQLSLFSLIFIVFLGFSFLSGVFLQIKTRNLPQLCSAKQPIGGLFLSIDSRTSTQILSQVIKFPDMIKQTISQPNKHQILFVFQNLCEIFTPYYEKVKHLQEIFLFCVRMGEVFFGVTLWILLYSKYKQTVSVK